jgi:hypothetical protein
VDDILFAPVQMFTESVKVDVEIPMLTLQPGSINCQGEMVNLQASGASSYAWSSTAHITNANNAIAQTIVGKELGDQIERAVDDPPAEEPVESQQ